MTWRHSGATRIAAPLGQAAMRSPVRDGSPGEQHQSARLEHAQELRERAVQMGEVIAGRHGRSRVEGRVGERQLLGVAGDRLHAHPGARRVRDRCDGQGAAGTVKGGSDSV